MKNTTLYGGGRYGLGALLTCLFSTAAWGQCACTTTLDNTTSSYAPGAGETVCIPSGVTFSGTLTIAGNGVTVCNSGSLTGTIQVSAGAVGTVINNYGSVSTNNIFLNAATTLTNGSSAATSATWGGYIGGNITAAPTIANYGTWQAQMQPLPGGTISNLAGATWNAYLTTSANLTVTNAGNWQTQIQEGGNSPTIAITHNGGSWTGNLGGGSGSLRIINNASWTVGFNFPGGSANAFTTAAGATTNFNGYLGMGGAVTISNNGTTNVSNGMGTLASGSSLTTAAGSTFSVAGDFTNQGAVLNRGTISSANFTNSGTITGPGATPRGQFNASGYTVNSGSFGADGSYLDFCDSTPPTPASNGFDAQTGTVGGNVTYCAAATPLPVVLASFTARRGAGEVQVRWMTASELSNSFFTVERSADGVGFGAVATVVGQGSKATATSYAARDAAPLPGPAYYRLRQVDADGKQTYSPSVRVAAAAAPVLLYPNPSADALTLDLQALPAAPCTVQLRTLLDSPVLEATLPGGQARVVSLASLPAGVYVLRLAQAGQVALTQRVIKQ